jgi:antitoxin (DNA-binding transcriptional repressor) of toxin-antitoxin stability system
MSTSRINLADAKARLSELTELADQGETIVITRHGRPVAQLTKPNAKRHPLRLDDLQRVTKSQPRQRKSAAQFIRHMRDAERF